MQLTQDPVTIPGTIIEQREIPSDVALVTPLVVRLVEKLVEQNCIGGDSLMKVELCLDEAITNSVVHGNRSDFGKVVQVTLWRDDDSWGVVIEDQGDGFTLEDLNVSGTAEEETLWQESGRGIPLMTLYMDEVGFYDGGRALLLRQVMS